MSTTTNMNVETTIDEDEVGVEALLAKIDFSHDEVEALTCIDYQALTQHLAWLREQSDEILQEMVLRQPLPAMIDFSPSERAAALRHAADWIDEGAPLGKRAALFSDLVDDETGDLIAVQRCAMGEAMLFLDDDVGHWAGVQPHRALLRWDDDPAATRLLSAAIEQFDAVPVGVAWPLCAQTCRAVADLIEPSS